MSDLEVICSGCGSFLIAPSVGAVLCPICDDALKPLSDDSVTAGEKRLMICIAESDLEVMPAGYRLGAKERKQIHAGTNRSATEGNALELDFSRVMRNPKVCGDESLGGSEALRTWLNWFRSKEGTLLLKLVRGGCKRKVPEELTKKSLESGAAAKAVSGSKGVPIAQRENDVPVRCPFCLRNTLFPVGQPAKTCSFCGHTIRSVVAKVPTAMAGTPHDLVKNPGWFDKHGSTEDWRDQE